MKLYSGIDLHSNNSYLAIVDENGKRIFNEKLANDIVAITDALSLYSGSLEGVVVESTYNWYWLVDGLMAEGFAVHLANPSAIKQYNGLKHTDDKHDAFWLAEMLRLNILPEGYIYPKEERPLRDLLRKRSHLVHLRTSLLLSLENIVSRNCGHGLTANNVRKIREDLVAPLLAGNEDLALAGQVSKETIDFLTHKIRKIETFIENKIKLQEPYSHLLGLPGVGKILALTIKLESGPIDRFPQVGNYASYCRKVCAKWSSNGRCQGSCRISYAALF